MTEKPKGTQETRLTLEGLRDGTWAYPLDIFRSQALLSPEETLTGLNDALRTVNDQGGRVIQLLKVDVEVEIHKRGGVICGPREERCFLIVQK